MTQLTKDNLGTFYDLVPKKNSAGITVLYGVKKVNNTDTDHPPFVVFKQGLGALADYNATVKLQKTGVEGVLPVLAVGDDYFIRQGFPDKHASKWAAVEGHADQIMKDAIQLSLAMLDAGVIDTDRAVMKGSDDITAKNLVISNNRLVFFDFEPQRTINWNAALTHDDEQAIGNWKNAQEKLIKSLAVNFHLSGKQTEALMQQFHELSGKIMATKGKNAATIWQQLINPAKEDSSSSYEPPILVSLPSSSPSLSKTTASLLTKTPVSVEPTTPQSVEAIFAIMNNYFRHKASAMAPASEVVVARMAAAAHVYTGYKKPEEPSVYDALEKLIAKHLPADLHKEATSMVKAMKTYLDNAYRTQLHDKDQLGERPRGPWGTK